MHRFDPFPGKGGFPSRYCRFCSHEEFEPEFHIDEAAEAAAAHAAHVLRPEDQMTELERKVVARFREHGDRWFGALPDWRNTEIGVGAENKITGAWIKDGEKVRYPREYHHRLKLSVDAILEAYTLLGTESMGDAVIVGAHVIADRKADGPVYNVTGMRKYWDQVGWSIGTFMQAHDGTWLRNRISSLGGMVDSVAEVRRLRRDYARLLPDGIDWDGYEVVRDPHPTTHEMDGTSFSHVLRVYRDDSMLLAFVKAPVEVSICARRLKDGRWMLATSERMRSAIREHETNLDGASGAPIIEADAEAHLLFM